MKRFLKKPRFEFWSGLGLILLAGFALGTDGDIRSVSRTEAKQVIGADIDLDAFWSIVLVNYTCQSSGCPSATTGCDSTYGTCKVGYDVFEYWGGTECKGAGFGGNICHELLLMNTCALSYNCQWDEVLEECELWQTLYIWTPQDCEYL